jgi:hypothetical protein
MKDNLKEDHYIYEILVQTGPMLSHGTTSKIQFLLNGDDGETQIRQVLVSRRIEGNERVCKESRLSWRSGS